MVPLSRAWAAAYCEWLSGRLPTNGEWERAARGVEGRYNPWSPIPENPAEPRRRAGSPTCEQQHHANRLTERRGVGTRTTRSFPWACSRPGVYGHYDLMGTPLEWVSDGYAPYPEGSVVDYTGPTTPTEAGITRGAVSAFDRIPTPVGRALTLGHWPYATLTSARCAFDDQPAPML